MTTFAEHPATPTADGALVRAYLAGDENALEILFRRYRPDVLRMMFSKTRNAPLAEDLTQDTMLRAQRYLATYNTAMPFWPWLHKIALNIATSECARRGAELPVDPATGIEPALPDPTEHVVLHALVMECLAKLPKRHQRALVLRYVEDRDPNDIAALLGLKRNALEQLLLRARKRFAAEFRARNAAFVPGFAGLSHRLRRAFAGLSNRLQYAGGTTFSTAGDFALGAAAFTVGGIGIVTTFGAHHDGADARAAAPRPGFTVAGASYSPAGTGVLAVSPRALPATLVGGTAQAPGPAATAVGDALEAGTDATAEDGTPAAPDAAPEDAAVTPGSPSAHGEDGDGTAPTSPVGMPNVAGNEPAAPSSPELAYRGHGPAPDTTVDVHEDGATAEVESDGGVADSSGKVSLSDQVNKQGEVMEEGIYVYVADERVGTSGSVYNSGDGSILCDHASVCV
jgi:RNA polymerase sigma-70 factor (ECF subfamily)